MKTYRRIVRKRLQAALRIKLPPDRDQQEPRIVVDSFDELPSEYIELDDRETA